MRAQVQLEAPSARILPAFTCRSSASMHLRNRLFRVISVEEVDVHAVHPQLAQGGFQVAVDAGAVHPLLRRILHHMVRDLVMSTTLSRVRVI